MSFSIPQYPKPNQFPKLEKGATPEEIVKISNQLLDTCGELVSSCEAAVKTALTSGKQNARIWAFHQTRQASIVARRLQVQAYFGDLETARQGALDSPISGHMHRSVQDALSYIKAEPGMPAEARTELLNALWAVKYIERDTERAAAKQPARRKPSTYKGPSAPAGRVRRGEKPKVNA